MKKIFLSFIILFFISIVLNGCARTEPTAADTAAALYEIFRYGDTEKLLEIGYPESYVDEATREQTESDTAIFQSFFTSLSLTPKNKQLEEIMQALSNALAKLTYTVEEQPSDDPLVIQVNISTTYLDFERAGDTAIKAWNKEVKEKHIFQKTQSAYVLKNALLESLNALKPSVKTVEKSFPFTRQNISIGNGKTYVMWAPEDPKLFAEQIRSMMTEIP